MTRTAIIRPARRRRSPRQERHRSRYRSVAILGLLPTALSVAYQYQPPGLVTLMSAVWPMLLFLAAELLTRRWHSQRWLSVALIPAVLGLAGVWWRNLAGLLAWGGAAPVVAILGPAVIVALFTIGGLISGGRLPVRQSPAGSRDDENAMTRA